MTNNLLSIRLTPGGLFISGTFHTVAPGTDFIARVKEEILTHIEQQHTMPDATECEVCTARITLIPQEELDQAADLFHFVLPATDREEVVLHAALADTDACLLYGIDGDLYHFIERNLPQVTYSHPMTELHRIFIQRSRQFSRPVLFAHTDEDAMSLLLYSNQQLQLAMRYENASPADRSYYLLNTWRQLNLDQQLDHLLLIGSPAHINQLRARVATYVKRTEMMMQNFQ